MLRGNKLKETFTRRAVATKVDQATTFLSKQITTDEWSTTYSHLIRLGNSLGAFKRQKEHKNYFFLEDTKTSLLGF